MKVQLSLASVYNTSINQRCGSIF